MQNVPVQFGPGSGPERSGYANDGVLINCFAEPSKGKSPFAVYVAPGLAAFSTFAGGGTVRGRFKIGNLLYVLCGETLYKVTSGGTSSVVGTILGSLPITAAINRKSPFQQAFIVADNNYYVLENDALSEAVPGSGNVNLDAGGHSVAFLDGYLIVGYANGQFNWSAINDALDWPALNFAEAEAKDDNLVRVAIFGDRLFLFGEASVEQWVNSGDIEVPFIPQQGALIERGCLSKLTPSELDNTIFWLDQKGFVVRSEGTIGRVVSTFAVHRDIQATMKLGEQDLISAGSWARDGHEFYELHGPDWCWVYDASTREWWKRESEDKDTWRARFHLRVFNKDLVASFDGAVLYEQSDTFFDEDGSNLIVKMRSLPVSQGHQRVRHNSLIAAMEMGVGNSDGPAHVQDPKLLLRWSDDGGNRWSDQVEQSLQDYVELLLGEIDGGDADGVFDQLLDGAEAPGNFALPLAPQGNYEKRIKLNRLGTSSTHGRTYEISISAPVNRVLIDCLANVTVLRD